MTTPTSPTAEARASGGAALPLESGLAALVRHTTNLIPVLRPKLPAAAEIVPYLETIDERQWYTNWGPLVTRLEHELSRHLGLERGGVVTTANATAGLTAALLALDLPAGSYCLMPSWTFPATPHAARAAGVEPWFHDVDRETWALNPDEVLHTLKKVTAPVRAVMVVAPFGAPLDIAAWERFEAACGLRVVIDAAASFDTAKAGRIPSVVSLHATKILGAGEGGFIATTDVKLRERMVACCNFGFQGSRSAMFPALNAKMSEYHAAVGLASFAAWPRIRLQHAHIAEWYRDGLSRVKEVAPQPGYGTGWVGSTTSVVLPPSSSSHVVSRLLELGVESRSWWGQGCHLQPAFADCPRGPLPVTEHLGERVLGLPHYPEMRKADVDVVLGALAESLGSRVTECARLA